jgi:carbon monoxide dehydrogenase subunit G
VEFKRTFEIAAPLETVWALISDVPSVAECIPGVRDVEMSGDNAFTCKLMQRVGSAKANFDLSTMLDIDEDAKQVVAQSDGRDRALASTVSARQAFSLSDTGNGNTTVSIEANVQITGKLATFGHRIIATKTEQVTLEALQNVDNLLRSRRAS